MMIGALLKENKIRIRIEEYDPIKVEYNYGTDRCTVDKEQFGFHLFV